MGNDYANRGNFGKRPQHLELIPAQSISIQPKNENVNEYFAHFELRINSFKRSNIAKPHKPTMSENPLVNSAPDPKNWFLTTKCLWMMASNWAVLTNRRQGK